MEATDDDRFVLLIDGRDNVICKFWQYGLIDWPMFVRILHKLVTIKTKGRWAIFRLTVRSGGRESFGERCDGREDIVKPGRYILLAPDMSPVTTFLLSDKHRPRHPSHSSTSTLSSHYCTRARARDGRCLVTGLEDPSWCRLKTAHIFPRAHMNEWIEKGYPALITNREDDSTAGGPSKIDSIQNVLTLRSDIRDAFDSYNIGINPDQGYIVHAFVPHYDDLAGRKLDLSHIQNDNERPLDALLNDHFFQCILKHMKGAASAEDEDNWDYEEALGDRFDLSRADLWGGSIGKRHLELELAHALHSILHERRL